MTWQAFLQGNGYQFTEQGEASLAAPPAKPACAVVPLTQFGLIRFGGPESVAFVHGQVSGDIKRLAEGEAQYTSYSTPKGRMLASFLALREGEDVLLALPRALQAAVQKRLSMYVLRSKTQAVDINQSCVLIGLLGEQASAVASRVFANIPAENMQSSPQAEGRLLKLADDRYLAYVSLEMAPRLWAALEAAGAQAQAANAWTLADVRAGVAWVQQATQEEFVPQMANMDLIGGISFKKGCYPGQEIVARMHYLGKLKRRCYRFSSSEPLTAGQPVYSPEMQGQASGLVALVAAVETGWEALVVVQTSSLAHGLHVGSETGPSLQLESLPYVIPEPADK